MRHSIKCHLIITLLNFKAQTQNPKFCVLDDNFHYGTEFYGIEQQAVITPLTERCFLTIWQASRMAKGTIICGRPNSGKTQTAKGFAQFLARFIYTLHCTSQTEFSSISSTLQGLAQVEVISKKRLHKFIKF